MFLHELPDFADLIAVTARNERIDPGLVEKDYWIMHCLWGLNAAGYRFELKGGTSLSKGYGLIDRFSEDIDLLIHPDTELRYGPNHSKPSHIAARRAFFDQLAEEIRIPGIIGVERDCEFDDTPTYRGAGIRLHYPAVNPPPEGLKAGILLEAGFDQVAPNQPRLISSWAYDLAAASGLDDLTDNRAVDVPCYEPGYTFVEKLQTISTKHRLHAETGEMPANFMRHYYDVYCLLGDPAVTAFIGTEPYLAHKAKRFREGDEPDITRNDAFRLSDDETRARYAAAYAATRGLYYRDQPSLEAILDRISEFGARL
ncbi:nucleotidyl transferase AbiEii/AbiGii toxin family protein (plasmid) [Glycocaulis abyssi]|uniref:Nucleotidyl transferase AbiEii/AbiGii toxin family protein n=1 Tax=Glycocaulis abyssi TaxID=1433403 RepID=A0ABV9NCL9_9PROT